MSEYEIVELFYLNGEALFSRFSAFSTAVFAYLAAGHYVSAGLSRPVAIGFTSLYTVFVLLTFNGVMIDYIQLESIIENYYRLYPEGWGLPFAEYPPLGAGVILIPFSLIWLGSVYYVHFEARKNSE